MAAGNDAWDANDFTPARVNHSYVWTVSAFRQGDEFVQVFDWNTPNCNPYQSPYVGSNFGNPPVDFSGSGENILSLYKNGGTFTTCGTSMATPHIAGLLLAADKIYIDGYVTGDPDGNADPIASSTLTLETPSVTASIQNNQPKLAWPAIENAVYYEIWRRVESSGSWGLWATVSGTSYTDTFITDPNLAIISIPFGPYDWVAYKVKAVNDDDIDNVFESSFSSIKYYETGSTFPE